MIKGKTESGFSYSVSEAALDDWELLEDLIRMDGGDVIAIGRVLDRLLGEKQKAKLKEHLRGENGRVSATAIINEVTEIFKGVKKGKNS